MTRVSQNLKNKRRFSKKECDKKCDALDNLIVSTASDVLIEVEVEEVIEWVKEAKELIELREANE